MPNIIIRFCGAVDTVLPTNYLKLIYSITYTHCGSTIACQLHCDWLCGLCK